MDKKALIAQIIEYLTEELAIIEQSAKVAREAATHDESKAEDEHDTRAIEAGYLAGAQAKRAEEIKAMMLMYRFLPVREYTDADLVCPGMLLELEHAKTRALYFLVPQGGGLVTKLGDRAVQVITPHSPMGEAVLGRKVGDIIEVELRGGVREYRLISVR